MDSSFFEYRDKTGAGSDSDAEVIDSSLVVEDSFVSKKKLAGKNQTVFVAESDSYTEDESDNNEVQSGAEANMPKSVLRRSSVHNAHVISSSDEDGSRRGSIPRPSESSSNKVVVSSSDEGEGEVSPELVPRRRPPIHAKSNSSPDTSIIGRCRRKKRMILQDSDTENSIVIEHDKHKKLACLKDTPLKLDEVNLNKIDMRKALLNESLMNRGDDSQSDEEMCDSDKTESYNETRYSDDDRDVSLNEKHHSDVKKDQSYKETRKTDEYDGHSDAKDSEGDVDEEQSEDKKETSLNETRHSDVKRYKDRNKKRDSVNKRDKSHNETRKSDDYSDKSDTDDSEGDDASEESDVDEEQSEDDGPDEDQMVMSRATRMSIMGVMPKGKDDDSDESDLIQSDEKSRSSSRNSQPDSLPDSGLSIHHTPEKSAPDNDTSHLSCSPFTSPLHDVTNALNQSERCQEADKSGKIRRQKSGTKFKVPIAKSWNDDEVTIVDDTDLKSKVLSNIGKGNKENVIEDDDVTIIETKPEIIALSSDDDEEKPPTMKKSPKVPKEKSPKVPKEESTSRRSRENLLKQYLAPPSYPNQAVVYVKKHVRENELSKLEKLRADLHNVKNLLEEMDLSTLPDGGIKLIERLSKLEHEVRIQGDKVANMVVEPDKPSPIDIARDGFSNVDPDKGLSWDEIQKQSNAVQPRMFGKQAMATHMAERNVILERLRDLHQSLDSRPPETQQASAPRALRTPLMPHQLHALAWLRWRETQRPPGGILADDMGLGKTITMISLILADKEGKISHDDDDDDDEDYVGRGSARLVHGGTLVVCPASLMQQWAAEVTKHCGAAHALSVCQHHGANRATHAHRLATYDLVLTTYNIMQRDKEKNGVLMKIRWRRIILDEAHIVRNHKSLTCAGVCALQAGRRWALTGTPVHNKDLDLFALLKFLRCTPFDDLTMWKKWIDNKSMGGQERLSTIMRCILLRRTKQQLQQKGQLACLPEQDLHVEEVTLTKEEMNVYQKVLVFSKTLFAQFLHQRAEKQSTGFGAPTSQKDSAYAAMHKKMIALQGAKPVKSHQILVLLLRLRQVCCHCGLIAAMLDDADADDAGAVAEDPAGQDLLAELNKLSLEDAQSRRKSGQKEEIKEEEDKEEEGTTVTEAIRSVLSPNNPVFELSRQSSKIQAVMRCLKENVFVNKGDKAVVVSQWTSVLRLVEQNLKQDRIQCVTLSGEVPVPARPPLIEKLNNPKSEVRVMLLSLCAGGVGLNLTGASHLLLLDPHWNPQLEQQAQDRVYRVGQRAARVHIYRFMCVDTVEQSIRKLQLAKLELAENVLTGAKHNNASKLSIEDLKVLFNMGQ